MKIRRIKISNYRGIQDMDAPLPEGGAVAKGRNGTGKTTFLRAVKAALLAQDVAPDAIRHGADRAEVLVDLDDMSVKRVITPATSNVSVSKGEFQVRKPQTYLTDLLGTSSLDPMDLLTLRGKERRARVLAALPVQVTVEQLRQWWPGCPDEFDVSGHGLEVVELARKEVYAARTEANRQAKEARRTAADLASKVPMSVIDTPPDVAPLQVAADEARARLTALRAQDQESRRAEAATAEQRAMVERLSREAQRMIAENTKPTDDIPALEAALAAAQEAEESARLAHVQAQAARLAAHDALYKAQEAASTYLQSCMTIRDKLGRMEELRDAITAASASPVPKVDLDNAANEFAFAADSLQSAIAATQAHRGAVAAKEAADAAMVVAANAEAHAKHLDTIVRALTEDAPASLLAASDGIAGLTLDGDDILLDGVRLDALCGAEQVRFCVEVARRANAKSKILVVDGLERLDPEQMDVFVREATRDGWQLLASRVDRGEMVLEAIEEEVVE